MSKKKNRGIFVRKVKNWQYEWCYPLGNPQDTYDLENGTL